MKSRLEYHKRLVCFDDGVKQGIGVAYAVDHNHDYLMVRITQLLYGAREGWPAQDRYRDFEPGMPSPQHWPLGGWYVHPRDIVWDKEVPHDIP